ncbi:MAG: DUF1795 domain-containing protein [Chitinivibrionales bacterium]|nr:DUF1795 domain-containing protein [Chitinivibrionales bacterium]
MEKTNNQFTLSLPLGWKETTVYTFEGPHDSGVQHNIIITIDNEPSKKIGLKDYAHQQIGNSKQYLPGFEMVQEREIRLPSGLDGYELVYKYAPSDELVLYQKQVFVIMESKGYCFTATFSKKTMKTIVHEVDEIISSFRPGLQEE